MSQVQEAVPQPSNKEAARQLVVVIGTMIAALAFILALPHHRYVRYQQFADTIQFHVRWVYERIHYDRTPIDVVVVGTSSFEAGISPVELQQQLSRITERPIHVANFALLQTGRNLHYALLKDLLSARPETSVLVLSVDEAAAASHPLFRYVADERDIVQSPLLINWSYFSDLCFIPVRKLSYFVQSAFPWAFGISNTFRSDHYLGTDLDRTLGYRDPEGTEKNGMRSAPPARLRDLAFKAQQDHSSTFRFKKRFGFEAEMTVERTFTREIVALANARGVKVVFLHIPTFEARFPIENQRFYSDQADYLEALNVSQTPSYYGDGAHLNRVGALVLTDWLAIQLAPLLTGRDTK